MSISQSVGRGGMNLRQDAISVQTLINKNIFRITPLRTLAVDGQVGSLTIAAIEEFQRRIVRLPIVDGRVDPNGKTLSALMRAPTAPPPPVIPTTGTFEVIFSHRGTTPDAIKGAAGTEGLYESTVTVSGPASGTFRGSIFPDNMAVKGRIQDGTYPLYLGLHRRSWKDDDGNTHFHTPTQADLCVRENGFRAALIVNNDASVPVNSESSTKTTSSSIHVHNGFQSQRYSDGCQTLHPSDWTSFIQIFLDAYPTLAEWTVSSKYVGKQIGNLVVQT